MTAFEQHLLQIDGLLNVTDEDRRPYTPMFHRVKTWLIREMRRVDRVFDKLFARTCLFGSYTNGVRLLSPHEFDIFLVLEFPFAMQIGVDDDRPGFVHLDLKEALAAIKADPNYKEVHETLTQLADCSEGYLRRGNFQTWLSNIIKKALKSTSSICGCDVTYEKLAVAHNLSVRQRSHPHQTISIDFVPAISFGKVWWMKERQQAPFKDDYCYSFYAVPKASNHKYPHKTNKYTFLMVNPMAEHELLWAKPNLTIVFRLLKSLRHCYGLYSLRSYFLTTLFLWEVERRRENFWDNSMLERLCLYFEDDELPHFWIHDCNLLDILKPEEHTEYSDTLTSVSSTLDSYPAQPRLSLARTSTHFAIPGFIHNPHATNCTMHPFEQHLLHIDGLINGSDEERQPFTAMFEKVKKWLIREMRLVDRVFDKLCLGTGVYGNYTNGVHLLYPYEFDIFLVLEFPFAMQIGLDDQRPGFVHLDLEEALAALKADPNYKDVHETLTQLVDYNNGYLRRGNFQTWIGNIIVKALKSCSCDSGYDVTYKKYAEAHHFFVSERSQPHKKISIDFVPAISFGKVWWMKERQQAPFKDDFCYSFYAVPKASNKCPLKTNMYTFLLVNPMAEHELLWAKPNLKIVFRLVRSLLDAHGMSRLKSYFLTNLFLWEVDNVEKDFWDNNSMLDKLWDYLDVGVLPHFWVEDWNLVDILDPEELTEYSDSLIGVSCKLDTYPMQPLLSLARTSEHFDLP